MKLYFFWNWTQFITVYCCAMRVETYFASSSHIANTALKGEVSPKSNSRVFLNICFLKESVFIEELGFSDHEETFQI